MKNLFIITILYLLLSMSQAWSLPTCPGSPTTENPTGKTTWNNCIGTFNWDGGSVVGEWKNGQLPYGSITFDNGNKYVGEFKDAMFHGQGTYTYASGNKYVGEWKDDKQHGQGTYTSLMVVNT